MSSVVMMTEEEMGVLLSSALSQSREPLLPPESYRFNVFLPLTYCLNDKNEKHVCVGIMGAESLGTSVSFTASQKRVVLPYHAFNVLMVNVSLIGDALDKQKSIDFNLNDISETTNSRVYVKRIFGKWFIQIVDADGNRISLSHLEWKRFVNYSPCISRFLFQIWRDERDIVGDIEKYMVGSLNDSVAYTWFGERLFDEVAAYKLLLENEPVAVNHGK